MNHWEEHLTRKREHAQDLAALRRDFPGFRIWREVTGDRTRLVAIRRHRGTSPHTVVTADLAELRSVLDGHRRISSSP